MTKKVRFGVSNTKYALWDDEANDGKGGYGAYKPWPGAVSLTLTREGGESSDFYADNGVYYTFAGTNGGYSAALECATVPDEVRRDILGEIADAGTGVQFETTDSKPRQFALLTETESDASPTAWVFYNCIADRIEMSANTTTDSTDVDTETVDMRIAAQNFTYLGEEKPFVKGFIEKTADNVAKFNAFTSAVVLPTAAAA